MSKKITDLQPQKANANKHTEHGERLLRNSLQKYGIADGITVAANDEAISGSLRIETLADMMPDVKIQIVETHGDTLIVNKRMDIATPETKAGRALSVAANQVAFTDYSPDGELLKEWNDEDADIRKMFADSEWEELTGEEKPTQDAEPAIDRAAELLEKWQVKTGDLWQIGDHRLICGDCTDAAVVTLVMGGEKATCLLTAPPYNVDYKGNYIQSGKILDEDNKIWEGKSFEDDIENFPEWLSGAYKVFDGFMDNGCAIYIWHPPGAEGRHFWTSWIWDDWHFQVDLVWNKQSLIISRWDYKPQHEPCMYGWKGTNRKWIGANNEPTVWDYPRQQGTSGGKREHPTEKPLPLFERCLKNHDASIVMEPFSGSGTTLVACQNLGRKCRAVEISPAYVAVALERMATAFPDLEIRKLE